MHGAQMVVYPVYYMPRAPAAPGIGTQHLKIPSQSLPWTHGRRDSMTPWIMGIERAQGWVYVRTHVVPTTHSLMHRVFARGWRGH